MTLKQLNNSYQEKKKIFHNYIDNIKKISIPNLYTIINPTLIKNPYASSFPLDFIMEDYKQSSTIVLFIKRTIKYYVKMIYLFISYFIAFILYKIYYTKKNTNKNMTIIIDIFALVDKVNKNAKFSENYMIGLYDVLDNYNIRYSILLRPYLVGKNPFKLIKFFKIINNDKRNFIFEYQFLSFFDFIKLFFMIILYPFNTLKLLQKEQTEEDKIFNYSLIEDIKSVGFDGFTRYILGKNLSEVKTIKRIYSWSEFQVVERSFNYGIRKNNNDIKLIGCQFFISYETYFNTYVDDIDYDMLSSPHEVLVNGKYYLKDRKKVKYKVGVSLRYKEVFNFNGIATENNILLLGSYIETDTKYMLESVKGLSSVLFKNHPAVDIKRFGNLSNNITIVNDNIYKLFENTKLVIGTASGTSVEAVACGLSVIIIASQDNLTVNPLVEYGKGKIWDIAFSKDDVEKLYNKLIEYRKNNMDEILQIASWYKKNFFIEPTEENIVKAFELDKRDRVS